MEIETKKYQYAVSITRYDEDSEQTELVDQWITADDAIELMMHIRDNVTDASETEQEEDIETDDEIEEKTVEAEPVKKPNTRTYTKRAGPTPAYDREEVRKDFIAGMSSGDVAKKHGVPVSTIYAIKNVMKNNGELGESTSQSVAQKSGESTTLPKSFGKFNFEVDEDLERDVADAIHDGETLNDLINSFPSAPLPTLKHLFEKYSQKS